MQLYALRTAPGAADGLDVLIRMPIQAIEFMIDPVRKRHCSRERTGGNGVEKFFRAHHPL